MKVKSVAKMQLCQPDNNLKRKPFLLLLTGEEEKNKKAYQIFSDKFQIK